MKKLTYFVDRGNGKYDPLQEYHVPAIGDDEIYARQLCAYFVLKGKQYELISNEMADEEEILVLLERGDNETLSDEGHFRGKGLYVEFRRHRKEEQYRRLAVIPCKTHFDVIRYLLKDVVELPELGQMYTTSTEIDEDRGCYVIYVRRLDEDGEE